MKNKTERIISIETIKMLILVLTMFIFIFNSYAWWDGSWPTKQILNISTNSVNTPENYTVKINLNDSNVGPNFNWNNECYNNQSRVRFVDSNDLFELPFWIKSCDNSLKSMEVWVKIDQNITSDDLAPKAI